MDDGDWLARQFDQNRPHLRAVAYRMLGSPGAADDALQEAWLKISRAGAGGVENLCGWLTTVVARVCLDTLRTRRAQREQPLGPAADSVPSGSTPETELAFADAIGPALLIVLDMLAPQERVAFVLHDLFDLPFEEIAPIVERTPAAARQLASRARRRVQGVTRPAPDEARDRELVSAFLAASREGDFERLLALLSPDAVLRADATSVRVAAARREHGGPVLAPELRGAAPVANAFKGRATAALPATIDGEAGAVWAVRGQVRSAFVFTIWDGKIAGIDLVMDEDRLGALAIDLTGTA